MKARGKAVEKRNRRLDLETVSGVLGGVKMYSREKAVSDAVHWWTWVMNSGQCFKGCMGIVLVECNEPSITILSFTESQIWRGFYQNSMFGVAEYPSRGAIWACMISDFPHTACSKFEFTNMHPVPFVLKEGYFQSLESHCGPGECAHSIRLWQSCNPSITCMLAKLE